MERVLDELEAQRLAEEERVQLLLEELSPQDQKRLQAQSYLLRDVEIQLEADRMSDWGMRNEKIARPRVLSSGRRGTARACLLGSCCSDHIVVRKWKGRSAEPRWTPTWPLVSATFGTTPPSARMLPMPVPFLSCSSLSWRRFRAPQPIAAAEAATGAPDILVPISSLCPRAL